MEQQNSNAGQAYHLIVVHPFGEFGRGAVISDADEVADVLAGENSRHVNKIQAR